ncbi:MAG: hypothetical protein JNL04_14875 [Rhodospirillaceae bacterium]|nr:hypothetical protein [Rhodospirillaceae bacterium]
MARNSSVKSSGLSKIRFVMVEAELETGDIGQVTQAIQNALRSSTAQPPPVKRLTTTSVANGATLEPELEPDDSDDEESGIAEPTPAKARGPRKPPPTPNIVDVDMNADVSLASFAQGKDTKSQHKKYLTAAAWLKEHRNINGVTADHIYTCFRSMGWPTNILDFWQPLRELKAKRYFTRNDANEYEINHLGLDYVRKLGGSNGAG